MMPRDSESDIGDDLGEVWLENYQQNDESELLMMMRVKDRNLREISRCSKGYMVVRDGKQWAPYDKEDRERGGRVHLSPWVDIIVVAA